MGTIGAVGVRPADVDRIKAKAVEYRADALDAQRLMALIATIQSPAVLALVSPMTDALIGLVKMRGEQATDFDVQVQVCADAGILPTVAPPP